MINHHRASGAARAALLRHHLDEAAALDAFSRHIGPSLTGLGRSHCRVAVPDAVTALAAAIADIGTLRREAKDYLANGEQRRQFDLLVRLRLQDELASWAFGVTRTAT